MCSNGTSSRAQDITENRDYGRGLHWAQLGCFSKIVSLVWDMLCLAIELISGAEQEPGKWFS